MNIIKLIVCLFLAAPSISTVTAKLNLKKSLQSTGTYAKLCNEITKVRGGSLENFPVHDISISLLVLGESIVWLKLWTALAAKGYLDSKVTRKIIHTGSAPLFIAHWPLYSTSSSAKYFAATVPAIQIIRLCYAGIRDTNLTTSNEYPEGKDTNELVMAVSRTGNKKEVLGGPLIYSVVLLLATLVYFRESPVGIVAVAQMAAGDGLADIFGRKWGSVKWVFAPQKSIIGTAAFIIGAFTVSMALLGWFKYTGVLPRPIPLVEKLPTLLAITLLSALTELLPGVMDDNLTVPLVAGICTAYWLHPSDG